MTNQDLGLEWATNQLSNGRLLIRGTISPTIPMQAHLELVCLVSKPPRRRKYLVVASYQSNQGNGATFKLQTVGLNDGQTWRDKWPDYQDQLFGGWEPHRKSPSWVSWQTQFLDRKQVLVVPWPVASHGESSKPLPSGDPRLLVHYGACVYALTQRSSMSFVSDEPGLQSMHHKLLALLDELREIWRQVSPD